MTRLYFNISENLYFSFSWTDSGLCVYCLIVWSNLNLLHNSLWITFPTQSCQVLYSFLCLFAAFAYFLINDFISFTIWSTLAILLLLINFLFNIIIINIKSPWQHRVPPPSLSLSLSLSLAIRHYCPSLLAGLPNNIQWPYWADVGFCWLANTGTSICRGSHRRTFKLNFEIILFLLSNICKMSYSFSLTSY